jgi:hypothetical protein
LRRFSKAALALAMASESAGGGTSALKVDLLSGLAARAGGATGAVG